MFDTPPGNIISGGVLFWRIKAGMYNIVEEYTKQKQYELVALYKEE
jgi:hypothetical protein